MLANNNFLFCISILILPLCAGCHPDYVEPGEMVIIQGEVYLDRQPVSSARVMFVPENVTTGQDFAISYGTTNGQGEFELKTGDDREGALIGKHRVYISKLSDDKQREKTKSSDSPLKPETAKRMENIKETWEIVEQSVEQPEGEIIPHYYNLHSDLTCEVIPGRGIQRMKFELSSVDPLLTDDQESSN